MGWHRLTYAILSSHWSIRPPLVGPPILFERRVIVDGSCHSIASADSTLVVAINSLMYSWLQFRYRSSSRHANNFFRKQKIGDIAQYCPELRNFMPCSLSTVWHVSKACQHLSRRLCPNEDVAIDIVCCIRKQINGRVRNVLILSCLPKECVTAYLCLHHWSEPIYSFPLSF